MFLAKTKKRILLIGWIVGLLVIVPGLVPISLSDAFVTTYGDAMDWQGACLAGRGGWPVH
jgi:hypothetical protein